VLQAGLGGPALRPVRADIAGIRMCGRHLWDRREPRSCRLSGPTACAHKNWPL